MAVIRWNPFRDLVTSREKINAENDNGILKVTLPKKLEKFKPVLWSTP